MSKKSKHSRNLVKLGKNKFICKCLVEPSKSKTQKAQVTQELKQYHSTTVVVPQLSQDQDSNSPYNDLTVKQVCTDHVPCNKEFTCISNLIVHQRIHSGTKPFECPYPQCLKKFASSGNMQDHMNRHTNTKPYSCDQCDQSFYRLNLLKTHQKKAHCEPDTQMQTVEQMSQNSVSVDTPFNYEMSVKQCQQNNGKLLGLQDLKSDISTEEQSTSVRLTRAYTEESQDVASKNFESDQESTNPNPQPTKLPDFEKFKKIMDYNNAVLSIIGWKENSSIQNNQIQSDQKQLTQFLFPAVRRVITPTFTKNQPPCKYY